MGHAASPDLRSTPQSSLCRPFGAAQAWDRTFVGFRQDGGWREWALSLLSLLHQLLHDESPPGSQASLWVPGT